MLKAGEIVESGSYTELMALKGDFYELVLIQTQEANTKKRLKNKDEEIKKLDKKLSTQANLGEKKLDKLIKNFSKRVGSSKQTNS